ncbi:hypothetical protein PAE9249_04020 [Paenibacillus sp. CECT 9249]|uniref:glycoside hydrolase family 31 protein n=1 Tax=Paenibacillus sp. CECT 9249 TaxID=2845385 RepID=UPI001E283D41|nr:TIM-barrel domain-containing protein [Paenibacillus sp. CECT 9249]CAH0121490.1 hypothetical protein PAE9249_04020 [Paenibacillus sp. CECT 9249]
MMNVQQSLQSAAFECYSYLKAGDAEKTLPFLREAEAEIRSGERTDTLDLAYWLWIVGEYTNTTGEPALMEQMADTAAQAVAQIAARWNEPRRHWLEGGAGEPAIYLSNLAVMYGAVLAVQPHWPVGAGQGLPAEGDLQRLLKEMRELLFAKLIKDGKVVSKLGSREIYGDIVVAAVPFGLLGIEDRILIEALFVVERELLGKGVRLSAGDTYYGGCERSDISSLLAWYYSEKGDLAEAKKLVENVGRLRTEYGMLPAIDPQSANEPIYYEYELQQAGGQLEESHFASALYSIAAANLRQKLTGADNDASGSGIHIRHEPTGTDDPYVYDRTERSPRYPESGELVFVRMATAPFREATQRAQAEFAVNGGEFRTVPMTIETAPDGEKYWQAAIGRFAYGDEVVYRFAVQDGEQRSASEPYRFNVREWRSLGKITKVAADAERIALHCAGLPGMEAAPSLVIARRNGGTAEMRLQWSGRERDGFPGNPASGEASIRLDGHVLTVRYDEESFGLEMRDERSGVVFRTARGPNRLPVQLLTDGDGRVYKARLHFDLQDGERAFGMGERYSRMEYRGYSVDNYVYNEYRSQGMKTYMPVPFYMSSAGYGVYLDTTMYSQFHFGSNVSDLLEIEVDVKSAAPDLTMYLFAGKPMEMIGQLANVTSKPALPPKWAFGPWMSSNNWDSQAEVAKQVELTNKYEIPATVIVLEQWSDEATFYIFNDAQYEAKDGNEPLRYGDFTFPEWGRWPNPKQMVADLHDNGLKVLLWQIPIQKYMYGIAHEQRDNDERAMLAGGYHVKRGNGEPYRIPYNWFKDCLVIDFSNEAAREWWFGKRQYLMDEVGIDGFKTDGGECIFGRDLQFADGSTGEELRNRYPLDYIGSYYDFVQRQTNGDGITFSRAGYSGAQKYPLHWAGDERSTYEAFRASIIAGLTSGMSGIPFWGWDLGGFHGDIPTAELFVRSTQMAAFCPVMQYHAETKGEFNQDRTPWNIAERTGKPEVIGIYKRYADIRMNLLPYIYDQAIVSSETGVPMMRAMAVAYPDDRACSGLMEQYMFGDSLLVAPVTEEGHYSKRVYFPEGEWLALMGDERIRGGVSLQVQADLESIPVYMRQDSVVALNLDSSLQIGAHVGNRVDSYDRLAFMIFAVNELDYRFQDDLGHRVLMRGNRRNDALELEVESNVQGTVALLIREVAGVRSMRIGDAEMTQADSIGDLKEGSYCVKGNDLYVTVPAGKRRIAVSIGSGGEANANE